MPIGAPSLRPHIVFVLVRSALNQGAQIECQLESNPSHVALIIPSISEFYPSGISEQAANAVELGLMRRIMDTPEIM